MKLIMGYTIQNKAIELKQQPSGYYQVSLKQPNSCRIVGTFDENMLETALLCFHGEVSLFKEGQLCGI